MKTFITDINGKKIEVTDLDEAINQAEAAVHWHQKEKKEKQHNPLVFYFPEAHKQWEHILSELLKLKKS